MAFLDTNKKRKKNLIFSFFALTFFCGAVFLAQTHVAHAVSYSLNPVDIVAGAVDFVGNLASAPILWVFNILLYAVWVVCGLLLIFAGVLLDWATNPNNFAIVITNNAGIYEGWKFVRDILNLFFIFTLLFSAFATVFQVATYNYKKILLKLVIMALLVNFSFPISRFIIDVSNVLFYGIFSLAGFSQSANFSSTLMSGLNIAWLVSPNASLTEQLFSASTITIKLIFSNIFLFLAAITFLIIGALFIIRIAVLAVLIIVSPVGFVAGIFPGTKKFADDWWSALINQSFFAPVMAMMLVVALSVMKAMNSGNALQKSIADTKNGITGDYSTLITGGAAMAIPLIILWVGMISAKKFGAIGADMVQKYATGAMGLVTKVPAMWVGRKYEKYMTTRPGFTGKLTKYVNPKWLAPTAVYEGWQTWRHHSQEKDRSPVTQSGAEFADLLGAKWPIEAFREHTDHAFKNYSANISKEQKEIAAISTNSDYVIHELIDAIKAEDDEKTIGALQILASNNDFNDMMHVMDRIQDETKVNFGKKTEEKPEGERASNDMSSENAKEVIKNMMLKTGTSPELAAKAMLNMSNTAIAAGNVGMAGAARFDKDTGEFVISSEEDQANVAAAKLQNLETQARQRTLHHNAIFKEESDDKLETIIVKDKHGADVEMKVSVGDINGLVGQKVLGTITDSDSAESKRSRDDLKREISNRMLVLKYGTDEQKEKLAGMKKIMDENENVKKYFKTIFEHYTGNKYDA